MLFVGVQSLVLKDTKRRDQLSQMTKGVQSTPTAFSKSCSTHVSVTMRE